MPKRFIARPGAEATEDGEALLKVLAMGKEQVDQGKLVSLAAAVTSAKNAGRVQASDRRGIRRAGVL